jgi:hypothetical protein
MTKCKNFDSKVNAIPVEGMGVGANVVIIAIANPDIIAHSCC